MTPTVADLAIARREAVKVARRVTGARVRVTVGAVTIEIDPQAPVNPSPAPCTESVEVYPGERAAAARIRARAAGRA